MVWWFSPYEKGLEGIAVASFVVLPCMRKVSDYILAMMLASRWCYHHRKGGVLQNIAEKRFAVDASERTFFVEIGGLQDRQVMEEARGNLGVDRSACAMPRGVKRPWS